MRLRKGGPMNGDDDDEFRLSIRSMQMFDPPYRTPISVAGQTDLADSPFREEVQKLSRLVV